MGGATSEQVVLGGIRKVAELKLENNPGNNVSLRVLFQFLPPRSCELLPWLSSMDCELEYKFFSSQVAFGHGLTQH